MSEHEEGRRIGEDTQFKAGNPGGPGRGNKKEVNDPWVPVQGRTTQETLTENANDFLAFCFRQARKGNNFIAATLINKLVPNGSVSLGGKKGLPQFEKMSDEELEKLANNVDAWEDESDDF